MLRYRSLHCIKLAGTFAAGKSVNVGQQAACLPRTHMATCRIYKTKNGTSSHGQIQNPHNIKYNGTIQGLKYIWRTEGFRGPFKGNGTNCARIVPNSAVKFFSYKQVSKQDERNSTNMGLEILETFFSIKDQMLVDLPKAARVNFYQRAAIG
ncbi:Mitochondrial substrate/solute carrier [Dillenia turbinata]|uniref:Mitochondrial substrate/solute carrier n=1 Tax=Dillenia turbinata TaxID=194707 RepID=A0AAN8YZ23_9MAGN